MLKVPLFLVVLFFVVAGSIFLKKKYFLEGFPRLGYGPQIALVSSVDLRFAKF